MMTLFESTNLKIVTGTVIDEAHVAHAFPGAQVLSSYENRILLNHSYGTMTYTEIDNAVEEQADGVTNDTLYDIASLSKLFTLAALLIAKREFKFDIQQKVAHFLPEFDRSDKCDITLRQLLNHSSGIGFAIQWLVPAALNVKDKPPASIEEALENESKRCVPAEKWLEEVASASLHHAVGSRVLYSCTNYFLLARIIEQIIRQRLDAFIAERLLQPLQMTQTTFEPLKGDDTTRIAPTEVIGNDGLAWRGIVHDEAARQWQRQTGEVCGNAGVFSTASDLGRFAQLWLGKGNWEGQSILSTEDVQASFTNTVMETDTIQRGWCWRINDAAFMSEAAPEGTVGHTGFTGPSFWLHPSTQRVCIILNNRVHPTRNGPNRMPYHRRIAEQFLAHT